VSSRAQIGLGLCYPSNLLLEYSSRSSTSRRVLQELIVIATTLDTCKCGMTFSSLKFHKFREFFEIFQDPLLEIFIEILYFNYNSPITGKKCQSS